MRVVASEIDDSTERIIRYLAETYGVDINAVRFQFFQAPDGRQFLVRTFTVAPEVVEQGAGAGRSEHAALPVRNSLLTWTRPARSFSRRFLGLGNERIFFET